MSMKMKFFTNKILGVSLVAIAAFCVVIFCCNVGDENSEGKDPFRKFQPWEAAVHKWSYPDEVLRKISTNTPIDIFGKIGEDPGETGWADMTEDHTLIRKQNVTGGELDALDDFLVVDEWDAIPWLSDSLNFTLDSVFLNLGTHTCECGTTDIIEQQHSAEVKIFPNPASGDVVWVTSALAIREVVLYNLAGQLINREIINGLQVAEFSLGETISGLYLMEVVLENGARTTRRVVLK